MSDLGRRIPTDWQHVQKYGIRAALPVTPLVVEDSLKIPYGFRRYYDQGTEGACVGFGCSWAMSTLNLQKSYRNNFPKYDANWLYRAAQLVDDWEETPPEEGTSVRAAMDVLRDQGHRVRRYRKLWPADPAHGIQTNRWATHVDEMRAAIEVGIPVVIGINWYQNFDTPRQRWNGEWWIGEGNLGSLRGGHCVCVYGASDERQAFRIVNNWGMSYPLVWMPYDTMQRMLNEYGEAAIITDRVEPF